MLKELLSTVTDAAGKVVGAAGKLVSEILPPVADREQMIEELITGQPVCFLGSVSEDGYPCVKAMLFPRGREGVKRLYFSTNTSSLRIATADLLERFLPAVGHAPTMVTL